MKTGHKIIIGFALVVSVINIYIFIHPLIKKDKSKIKTISINSKDDKDILMNKIINLLEPPDIERMKNISELWRRIVSLDSIDWRDLVSYSSSLLELSYNIEDSAELVRIDNTIIHNLGLIKKAAPYNYNALLEAGLLYRSLGSRVTSCYDSAETVYNRMLLLIKSDSMEVPDDMQPDREKWLKELNDHVNDLKTLNGIQKSVTQRKYFFIS